MENKKLISIIIPVYNSEKYLPECLQSVIEQTYTNLEIIVINDGSTDNSLKIIEKYREMDNRVICISQGNQGVSAARNNGLLHKTGEYVMFLDSDDWLERTTCEKALDVLEKQNADIVLWGYIKEYPHSAKPVQYFGKQMRVWKNGTEKEVLRRIVGPIEEEMSVPQMVDSMVTVWGKLYRTDIIENISFVDLEIIGTQEDVLYNMDAFYRTKVVVYSPDTYLHYRKDMGSLTHCYKKNLPLQWRELYHRIHIKLDEWNLPKVYYQALENRICLALIGLGLNIAEDESLSQKQREMELKSILNMPHYKSAFEQLNLKYIPLIWKPFFIFAKYRRVILLVWMLRIMERMRKR